MSFQASCHCQAVRVTVEAPLPTEAMECNCSICRRQGYLLQFFPAELGTVQASDGQVTTYTFNKHVIKHQFCKTCGVGAFAHGELNGKAMVAVNLRCVPEIDPKALKVNFYNGAER